MNILKKYIFGFFKFWHDFIVGDEWQVAAAVLWAFLLTYSLSLVFIPSWYVVPVVVSILLYKSVSQAQQVGGQQQIIKLKEIEATHRIWGLLCAVLLLPELAFRLRSGNFNFVLQNFLLPFSVVLLAVVVCGGILGLSYKKYPMLTTAVAVSFCILVLNFRDKLTPMSSEIVSTSNFAGWLLVIISLVVATYAVLKLSKAS